MILPSIAIGISWVGYLARMVRASMLEVMARPTSAPPAPLACPRRAVVTRYALRIAIIPTISMVAVGFGSQSCRARSLSKPCSRAPASAR